MTRHFNLAQAPIPARPKPPRSLKVESSIWSVPESRPNLLLLVRGGKWDGFSSPVSLVASFYRIDSDGRERLSGATFELLSFQLKPLDHQSSQEFACHCNCLAKEEKITPLTHSESLTVQLNSSYFFLFFSLTPTSACLSRKSAENLIGLAARGCHELSRLESQNCCEKQWV